jgi:hypothetical protein
MTSANHTTTYDTCDRHLLETAPPLCQGEGQRSQRHAPNAMEKAARASRVDPSPRRSSSPSLLEVVSPAIGVVALNWGPPLTVVAGVAATLHTSTRGQGSRRTPHIARSGKRNARSACFDHTPATRPPMSPHRREVSRGDHRPPEAGQRPGPRRRTSHLVAPKAGGWRSPPQP